MCRGVSGRCWAGVGCGEVVGGCGVLWALWLVVLCVVRRAWGVCGGNKGRYRSLRFIIRIPW